MSDSKRQNYSDRTRSSSSHNMREIPLPTPKICPKCGSTMGPGFVAFEMHIEDPNRVDNTVRGFTYNNCGYHEKVAEVNKQEGIGEGS